VTAGRVQRTRPVRGRAAGPLLLCWAALALSGCATHQVQFAKPELIDLQPRALLLSAALAVNAEPGEEVPGPARGDVLCICRSDSKNAIPPIAASGRPDGAGPLEAGGFEVILRTPPGLWIGRPSLDPIELGFARRSLEFLDRRTGGFTLICGRDGDVQKAAGETSGRHVELAVFNAEPLFEAIRPLYNRPLDILVVDQETEQPVAGATITIRRSGKVGFSEHFRCCEAVDWAEARLLGPEKRELATDESGRFVETHENMKLFISAPAKHTIRVEAPGYHPARDVITFFKNPEPVRLRIELARAAALQDPPRRGKIIKLETPE
jgi:hypothetical protein